MTPIVNDLGGYSLEDLHQLYRSDLFEYYLPYVDRHIYDGKYGGFLCHIERNGHHPTANKRTWYDGRGIWVYASLYHELLPDPVYLERAIQTLDFMMSFKSSSYPYWPWGYSQTGEPLDDQQADIYGGLFVAEGMAALAKATNEDDYWHDARMILKGCIEEYDHPRYEYVPHFKTGERLNAPRVLGHWMIMLNLAGHLLDYKEDEFLQTISDRCIDALLNDHYQTHFDLMIEYLHHDFAVPETPLDQFAYLGHGIEVLWMVMAEAQRRQDQDLWNRASYLFKRHVEVAWDDVHGGIFHELTHVDNHAFLLDKVLWAQEEVLVGLMMLIEAENDPWAIRWFNKVYPYVRKKFILHDHPDQLWVNGGDRQIKVHHQVDRFENYHHPRHLIKNIRALERMTRK